jgi:hypothetical protein
MTTTSMVLAAQGDRTQLQVTVVALVEDAPWLVRVLAPLSARRATKETRKALAQDLAEYAAWAEAPFPGDRS